MREVIENEIYIDEEPTGEYVCDECGNIVNDLREWGNRKVCSECEEMLDIELEELQQPNW